MDRKIDPTIAAFAGIALSLGAGAMAGEHLRTMERREQRAAEPVGSPKRAKNRAQKKARKATRKARK